MPYMHNFSYLGIADTKHTSSFYLFLLTFKEAIDIVMKQAWLFDVPPPTPSPLLLLLHLTLHTPHLHNDRIQDGRGGVIHLRTWYNSAHGLS